MSLITIGIRRDKYFGYGSAIYGFEGRASVMSFAQFWTLIRTDFLIVEIEIRIKYLKLIICKSLLSQLTHRLDLLGIDSGFKIICERKILISFTLEII